jgi:ribosomal protein L7/L12
VAKGRKVKGTRNIEARVKAGTARPGKRPKEVHRVVITGVRPEREIQVIAEIRGLTNLGLKETKYLAENHGHCPKHRADGCWLALS